MIADHDVRQNLKDIALGLLNNPQQLKQMSKASAQLGKPQAGREIAAAILEMIR